jgi:hypothetical protein
MRNAGATKTRTWGPIPGDRNGLARSASIGTEAVGGYHAQCRSGQPPIRFCCRPEIVVITPVSS